MVAILPPGKTIFVDSNGTPLAAGFVYFYVPGTTMPSATWTDQTQTSQNTNPVILDAFGGAYIWGSGVYRQIVTDQYGNQIWDAVTGSAGGGGGSGLTINSIGSGLALSVAGVLSANANGLTIAGGITATGGSQSTATVLTANYNVVTTTPNGTGVILSSPTVQQVVARGAYNLNVYPPTGAQIENAGVNVAVPINPLGAATFIQTSATQWYAV